MKRLLATVAISGAALMTISPVAAGSPGRGSAFNFRLGGFLPSGDSDFWDTNQAAFTINPSDLDSVIAGVGYSSSLSDHFEFDVNADVYAASTLSADSYYTDQNGDPILHDTRLSLVPVTFGIRVLPAGRYARRGADRKHYVRRPVPYFGAGIGAAFWEYEEEGDFVASDLSIVYDRYTESGVVLQTYAMAGIEFPVGPEWNITFEVRQSWAEATPGGEFAVVNPGSLDLGGTSVFVGGSFRF